jgi:hypothetical protein
MKVGKTEKNFRRLDPRCFSRKAICIKSIPKANNSYTNKQIGIARKHVRRDKGKDPC